MPKLEGIIYKAFGNYVVLRGFAPIGDIASISKKPKSYQRNADEQHKIDIINYLNDTKAYFPEVTLACRADDYEGLIQSIGSDKDVSNDDGSFVNGLRVLKEYIPQGRDRARHAFLELNKPTEDEKLTRVDGNHRLEPFSSDIKWWYKFINIPEDVENETDPTKKEGWIKHQANEYKKKITDKIVPFTIIISDGRDADNFEAKVFHDINFKQLPLRQEASLRIISELKTFEDFDKLGEEYPLTIKLIQSAENGLFDYVKWLKKSESVENDYHRTTCLRIIQLLLKKKESVEKEGFVNDIKIGTNQILIEKHNTEKEGLIKKIDELKESLDRDEKESDNTGFVERYNSIQIIIKKYEDELRKCDNKLLDVENVLAHLLSKREAINNYLGRFDDIDTIKATLQSLRSVYESFSKGSYGNIALLVALVYYSILDKNQLQAFVRWVMKNGINKITEPDDLSSDASVNLIHMFEQVYLAKKSEVFISMQFGDSQSELIYEKVIRAIEVFNKKHQSIHLRAKPIRIDRTIEPSTYSIQDKILDAINSCSLIIADLSSHNINVYHEIGYAMGIAKSNNLLPNMILLYKEDSDHKNRELDVDKFIGFNLRNLSQLRFRDYKQLVDGLVERLEKHFNV